jgi:adenine-specific DNA-methyltransferase
MQNLLKELTELLSLDDRLVSEGRLMKNKIVELALAVDPLLLRHLLSSPSMRHHFFSDVDGIKVFDKIKFQRFVNNKSFLPDSYTAFKNKVGLTTGDEYVADKKEVVLTWPYKDCVLEGGQEKEDAKREEVFWNETLAPDQIDRLLSPKALVGAVRHSADGDAPATAISKKDNLIIKGNNLLSLHTLLPIFRGEVKLMYLDPPYNTSQDSFQYNDSFNHSTWLTFMRNRLTVAKQLLRPDGVIFVQCDYIEFAYLKVLMDEVFGSETALPYVNVKTATPAGFKVVNPGLVNVSEHILIYARGDKKTALKSAYVKAGYQSDYKQIIHDRSLPVKDWTYGSLKEVVEAENPGVGAEALPVLIEKYALKKADQVFATYGPHKPSERMKQGIEKSNANPDSIVEIERDDGGKHYLLNGRLIAFYSSKLQTVDGEVCPTQRLTDFWSDLSWDSIAKEGGVTLKNGKKPERLLKRILELASEEGDLVMDFHLGSGTTAAVAMKMRRRFIGMEQLDYGANDSITRLKNVVAGDSSGVSKIVKWEGGGSFVSCELGKANQLFVERISSCDDAEALKKIWNEMQERAFLSYRVSVKSINENYSEFDQLPIEDRKKFLIETLDKNLLYIPLSEIDDESFGLSESDRALNRAFFVSK